MTTPFVISVGEDDVMLSPEQRSRDFRSHYYKMVALLRKGEHAGKLCIMPRYLYRNLEPPFTVFVPYLRFRNRIAWSMEMGVPYTHLCQVGLRSGFFTTPQGAGSKRYLVTTHNSRQWRKGFGNPVNEVWACHRGSTMHPTRTNHQWVSFGEPITHGAVHSNSISKEFAHFLACYNEGKLNEGGGTHPHRRLMSAFSAQRSCVLDKWLGYNGLYFFTKDNERVAVLRENIIHAVNGSERLFQAALGEHYEEFTFEYLDDRWASANHLSQLVIASVEPEEPTGTLTDHTYPPPGDDIEVEEYDEYSDAPD